MAVNGPVGSPSSPRALSPERASSRRRSSVLTAAACLLAFAPFAVVPAAAQTTGPFVSDPVAPYVVTADPADLGPVTVPGGPSADTGRPEGVLPTGVAPPRNPHFDPTTQLSVGPPAGRPGSQDVGGGLQLTDPIQNFAGILANVSPPDTVGDVGADHYVQMTNGGAMGGNTTYQIFLKDGTAPPGGTGGPFRFGGIWPAGDACNSDLGDPIVVYDHLADRWLLSQFARTTQTGPFFMCIAISQTPDPTANSWYLYTLGVPNFPDYPKFGVWPDGYYMSTFDSANGNLEIFAFDRANMLAGFATPTVRFALNALGNANVRSTRILPADLDGPSPPAGTPNFFVRTVDDQQDTGTNDRIEIYSFVADWVNLSFSFALTDTLNTAPFQVMLCDRTGQGAANPNRTRDCIPQPDVAQNVDALSNRPLMQLKFRDFGSHQAMVFNQAIDVSGSINPLLGFTPANEVAGVRWYEVRDSGAGWGIHQQGTYAPQPIGATMEEQLLHRWMGSIAMDKDGNLALGYNVSNDDDTNGQEVYPSLRYTGRLADDLLHRMPQGEKLILAGTNSTAGNNSTTPRDGRYRWGDYAAMSVDPVDDCTFYFTGHIASPTGTGGKPTQIASFVFESCNETDLAISKTARTDPENAGAALFYDVTVENLGSNLATNVVVTDTLPLGVTHIIDGGGCTEGPIGTLTCPLGDLAPGAVATFAIKVRIDPDLVVATGGAGVITNVASVDADQSDPNPANNLASATTLVEELADLKVAKLCKPDTQLPAGEIGICTLIVDNDGPSHARSVTVDDTMVSNGSFTILGATPSTGSCACAGASCFCQLGDVEPKTTASSGRRTVDIQIQANDPIDINNLATVASATPDPDPTNNQATGAISVSASADLSLTKGDAPDPVAAGTQLVYTLQVANAGPSAAANVIVNDVLPAGVSVDSVSATGGASCNAGVPGDPFQPTACAFGTLIAGAAETMTITVTVLPGTVGILHNDARVVSDTVDPDGQNDLAAADTTVTPQADLRVEKFDFPDPVVAGESLTYQVRVTNEGPSTATVVELSDDLPPETSFDGYTILGGSGACVLLLTPAPQVVCSLNDLEPGAFVDVFIDVTVDASVPDGTVISNSATATTAAADPNAANNTATEDTTVLAEADLVAFKWSNFPSGNPSATFIWSVLVQNFGSSDAQNVVITGHAPALGDGAAGQGGPRVQLARLPRRRRQRRDLRHRNDPGGWLRPGRHPRPDQRQPGQHHERGPGDVDHGGPERPEQCRHRPGHRGGRLRPARRLPQQHEHPAGSGPSSRWCCRWCGWASGAGERGG